MRYHQTAPLSLRSPHFLVELSAQRSTPTCSLSLANISASSKASSESSLQTVEMQTDSSNVLVVSVQSTDVRCTIPFPKRPHSLLRSTAPRNSPTGDSSQVETTEDTSPQDQDPPRKRTRTSALSTSTRSRPRRIASLHIRNTSTSATSPRSIAPLSISPPTVSLSVTFPLVTSSHDPEPQSELVPFPSISSTSISCVASTLSSSPAYSSPPSPPATESTSTFSLSTWQSTNWYRRRMTPAEMKACLYLYRTLIYGLEIKYHQHGPRQSLATPEEVVSRESRIMSSSCFDVQDAILAQHLKNLLIIHGVDVHCMIVNVEDIAREGIHDDDHLPCCDGSMVIDSDNSTRPSASPLNSDDFLHPHLHPSIHHSVISYQQLVATLFLRHHFDRSSRSRPKIDRQPGKRSSLAECISLH
ncbi:hypothetical protein CVT25_004884 [Psilocybe cyanescens]|uniref:Uncharacterized protein n=1 Tax=Psilocybe cyanescens TaxID=93625 RepID=A0A409XBE7_PSICY|nr:hypothetical protein CVT25_004884 [Psilocybe cyanescens]